MTPATAVIKPNSEINVDIILNLQEEDRRKQKRLTDKFAIFYIPLEKEEYDKSSLEQYIKKNSTLVGKIYLGIKINF